MTQDTQHIYLYMNDSGKISKYEDYAIFAGIVFHDNKEKSEFTNKYKSIKESIKCRYCKQINNECDKTGCPEVKAASIKNKDRRRIIHSPPPLSLQEHIISLEELFCLLLLKL